MTKFLGVSVASPLAFKGAFLMSLGLHSILILGLYYSRALDSLFIKQSLKDRPTISASLKFSDLYKPTDTPMKKGSQKKDLPPPKIKKNRSPEKAKSSTPLIRQQESQANLKKSVRSILDKIKEEADEEKRRAPKDDNFPTHEKGTKGARGTGGRGDRMPTPGEMAIQAAMRKYYEASGLERIKRTDPDAMGFYSLKMIGLGDQFQITSLALVESTGYDVLNRLCEVAVRTAVQRERFAPDIIRELSGRETVIICQP